MNKLGVNNLDGVEFSADSIVLTFPDFLSKFVNKFVFGQGCICPLCSIADILFIYILAFICWKFSVEGICTLDQLSI